MRSKPWLVYALLTVGLWGVWGALIDLPAEHGFPETLIYCVWSLTMIPPALLVLRGVGWKVQYDRRSIALGLAIGLLGAGGQLLLFHAARTGPAYLIFPIISLSPVVTVLMALAWLGERTGRRGALGIVLALAALPLFDYSGGGHAEVFGQLWFLAAVGVMVAWGIQAYFMRLANATMTAESIFFYMTVSGLVLAPVALAMTDFSVRPNYGLSGPWLAAAIQLLNSVGAYFLVVAFRHGRSIVVAPLANAAAPLVTSLLSIALLGATPTPAKLVAMGLALFAALLLALEPETPVEATDAEPVGRSTQ